MEHNKCKCGCKDTEYADESVKDNPNEPNEEKEYGCGYENTDCIDESHNSLDELEEDNGCGYGDKPMQKPEADAGCGCGAIDYPDLSRVENPHKPKFTAADEFIKEFENYAHSLGISSIGYTLVTPELLIKDKFIQYPFTIVLAIEMGKDIIETPPGEDAKDLNDTAYVKLDILTTKLSDYLRKNSFATEIAHPYGGLVNFSALA
jgi:hypothetical protein